MLKKIFVTSVFTALFSSTVNAAYPTTIERVYYDSASKNTIVGYWTLGCVINNSVRIGLKTNFYEDLLPAAKCSSGPGGFNTGACIMTKVSGLDISSPSYSMEFDFAVNECTSERNNNL
ncbi:hypothetical protein EXT42_08850 [Pseudoalteromonas sp. CO302Y]|uniref:hypothetical protein n=1 Tax=unclassified Pseudoalteromonas TaxID=194690 RepID=UPI001022C5D4|nr:hypothetical protein EXT42_08850 [Pseudoalteromonas sp. CO302Y]RZG09965.1 hypothetical protein EXT40_08860 [Pseudoalteromonas sp. CO133X]